MNTLSICKVLNKWMLATQVALPSIEFVSLKKEAEEVKSAVNTKIQRNLVDIMLMFKVVALGIGMCVCLLMVLVMKH